MINFVAQISFGGIEKEKNINLHSDSKGCPKSQIVKTYSDEVSHIKYSAFNEAIFVKNIREKKLVALAFIFDEDRSKLRNILKVSNKEVIKDSELVLDLYLRFGERGLRELSHGFILIIVDYHKKIVRAFRDHIGIKNICYYQTNNSIYLSSSFKNLYKIDHLLHTPNKDKIENFLYIKDSSTSDTFTNEIKKVPPMSALKFYKNKIHIYKYSSYELSKNSMPHTSQVKGLKDLLLKSVATEESNNHSRIGFLFSGGIDSSTILSFFRSQKRDNEEIFCFSAQFNQIDQSIKHLIDESQFQDELLKLDDINSFVFNGQDESTLSNLDLYLEIIGQPFFFPNLYITKRAFHFAHENKITLVINGNDGDTIISHGYEYLLELFFSFRWVRLYKEINATSKTRKQSKAFIFNQTILKNISFHNFINRSSTKKHLEAVLSNNHNKAIEVQTLMANYYGIEEKYPFYNRDLIEYCLNVSPELKIKDGHSRYVLKEAIKGIVPEKIRLRTKKSNLGHALSIGYIKKDRAIIQEQLNKPHALTKAIMKSENLEESYKKLLQNPRKYATRSSITSKIFSYTVLNKWLNDNFNETY